MLFRSVGNALRLRNFKAEGEISEESWETQKTQKEEVSTIIKQENKEEEKWKKQ